jgi:ABC-2 type transport system permease protein
MRGYWAVVSARFRTLLQYRAAAIAGFSTQLFWGIIRVMIFYAFYQSTRAPQPMSIAEVITYIWLGQALLRIVPWDVEGDIRQMVQSGAVAYELLRPLDLYWLWYCRCVAWRTAPTVLRSGPIFVVAIPFLGMGWPASPAAAAAWVLATLGAVALSAALTAFMSVSLLWTISGQGAVRIMAGTMMLFSGLIVPLPLLPEWSQAAVAVLPFRGIMDLPFRLYMGHIPASGVVGVLAHQAAWTVAIVAMGRLLLARGLRRIVVQGG